MGAALDAEAAELQAKMQHLAATRAAFDAELVAAAFLLPSGAGASSAPEAAADVLIPRPARRRWWRALRTLRAHWSHWSHRRAADAADAAPRARAGAQPGTRWDDGERLDSVLEVLAEAWDDLARVCTSTVGAVTLGPGTLIRVDVLCVDSEREPLVNGLVSAIQARTTSRWGTATDIRWVNETLEIRIVHQAHDTDPPTPAARPIWLVGMTRSQQRVVVPAQVWPHLAIVGPDAVPTAHTAIFGLLQRLGPAAQRLVMVDPQHRLGGLYDRLPHVWQPPTRVAGDVGLTIQAILAEMQQNPTHPPLCVVVVDPPETPDGAGQLQRLMRQPGHRLMLLLVQTRPRSLFRGIYRTIPLLLAGEPEGTGREADRLLLSGRALTWPSGPQLHLLLAKTPLVLAPLGRSDAWSVAAVQWLTTRWGPRVVPAPTFAISQDPNQPADTVVAPLLRGTAEAAAPGGAAAPPLTAEAVNGTAAPGALGSSGAAPGADPAAAEVISVPVPAPAAVIIGRPPLGPPPAAVTGEAWYRDLPPALIARLQLDRPDCWYRTDPRIPAWPRTTVLWYAENPKAGHWVVVYAPEQPLHATPEALAGLVWMVGEQAAREGRDATVSLTRLTTAVTRPPGQKKHHPDPTGVVQALELCAARGALFQVPTTAGTTRWGLVWPDGMTVVAALAAAIDRVAPDLRQARALPCFVLEQPVAATTSHDQITLTA